MPVNWPSPGDYSSAIQNPINCFVDPELKNGKAAVNHLGLPIGASGNFAVVYKVATGKRVFAARCFIRPPLSDQQKRYEELHRHLSGFSIQALVPFAYLPEGIRVRGRGYPLVRMEWINGQQLHKYVAGCLDHCEALNQVASRWRGVIAALRGAHTAHGDLQHGNVLIDPSGQIMLVDYDGFFIPALRGHSPGEVGHPNYQHPERIEYGLYDENADNFSAFVIYLSLLAVRSDRTLWDFHNGENLIFLADDFKRPGQSPVWLRLKANPDHEVRRLLDVLEAFCRRSAASVPDLESVIQRLPLKAAAVDIVGTGERAATAAPQIPLVQRLDQIRGLVSVALADGILSPEEEKQIQQLGSKLQVSTNDIEKIIREEKRKIPQSQTSSPQVRISAPDPSRVGTPNLEISKSEFEFRNLRAGGTAQGSVTISNTGGGILQGSIRSNRTWLKPVQHQIDPHRHRQAITFNVDTSGLPLGFKERGEIEIRSNSGTVVASVDVSVEVPETAIQRFRTGLAWIGVLVGGMFGFVLYQLLPNNGPYDSTRDVVSGIAACVALITVIVVGAKTGGFGGGCGGFIVSLIVLSILEKSSPETFSIVSWAISYGSILYWASRALFVARQTKRKNVVAAVASAVVILTVAVIAVGAYVSERINSGPVAVVQGVWRGSFLGSLVGNTPFEAQIQQNGPNVVGRIVDGQLASSQVIAQMTGLVRGNEIYFQKRYSDHVVSYSGRVSGNSMSGTWSLGSNSGTWQMQRVVSNDLQDNRASSMSTAAIENNRASLIGSWKGVMADHEETLSVRSEQGQLRVTVSYPLAGGNVEEQLSVELQNNNHILLRGFSYRLINVPASVTYSLDTFDGEIRPEGPSLVGTWRDSAGRTGNWSVTKVESAKKTGASVVGPNDFDPVERGEAYGISYAAGLLGRAAIFSRDGESRIEFPHGIPREGTLEWWIKIDDAYRYDNFSLHEKERCALLFASDVEGGDVTWPGATKLFVCNDGEITFDMAQAKYNDLPHQQLKVSSSNFRFGEWHALGISYGSNGQAIELDGKKIGFAPNNTQWFGVAGTHQGPADIPTIGEAVSHFWQHRQYTGGFEGSVNKFRLSSKQNDWLISQYPPQSSLPSSP